MPTQCACAHECDRLVYVVLETRGASAILTQQNLDKDWNRLNTLSKKSTVSAGEVWSGVNNGDHPLSTFFKAVDSFLQLNYVDGRRVQAGFSNERKVAQTETQSTTIQHPKY